MVGGLTTADSFTRTDLDSHADTACFGHNALVVDPGTSHVTVYPFKKGLGSATDIPIVTAAIAYDQPLTGNTFIFIFHQALYFGNDMDHNLLNSNQMRMNGLVVNECPKFLSPVPPTVTTHSLYAPDDDLLIPLYMHGVNSFFHSRKPSQEEYDQCPHIVMTASDPEWNPHSLDFANQEESITDENGDVRNSNDQRERQASRMMGSMNISAIESTAKQQCELSNGNTLPRSPPS